ncbi:protein-tyrosine phosphatase-like protein [Myxozyma melibiosi]|uniref:Protein-tyrosine phosphatase-like protein n=1 Tax=Myxozyma melibiosi TaxID=54550 RepID=A0ABR1FAC4_9ASCO
MNDLDRIKITVVNDVQMVRRGNHVTGTLHLTAHHLIFRVDARPQRDSKGELVKPGPAKEVWICYPIMAHVERRAFSAFTGFSALRIRCRDFTFVSLNFKSENDSRAVFDTLMALTCVPSVDSLYAFYYHPGSAERSVNTWDIYDPIKEFQRMGVGTTNNNWRFTSVNSQYEFCPTYPGTLVVPSAISDSAIMYAGKYRSKARIPALSYIHSFNNCTITRCSQPLVGLKQNRSPQDEKFIEAIFSTTQVANVYGASQENLICDARPTTNAIAQTALGAGSENMENYRFARKVYLGIDNIHVMRASLDKVYEALKDSDITPLPPNRELLYKSNWLKHISTVMEGAVLMGQRIHYYHSHVLVHCSDGWDRTAQLSSLAQIFLDPYFRTIDGFITIVEKEWLAFGHRFAERCGHLSSEKSFVQVSDTSGSGNSTMSTAEKAFNSVLSAARSAAEKAANSSYVNNNGKHGGTTEGIGGGGQTRGLKYTAPIFHQFLDCVYQLLCQFPNRFEYNERFLRRMLYHLNSCQYGTFLYNNEKERLDADVRHRAQSVWNYFVVRRKEFINQKYDPSIDNANKGEYRVIFPDPKNIRWWHEIFGRTEEEMSVVTLNGIGSSASAVAAAQKRRQAPSSQHQALPPRQQNVRQQQHQQQRPQHQKILRDQELYAQQHAEDSSYTAEGATSFDSFKETASATISSWASSIAEASNAWATAATPYLVSTYADAVVEDEAQYEAKQRVHDKPEARKQKPVASEPTPQRDELLETELPGVWASSNDVEPSTSNATPEPAKAPHKVDAEESEFADQQLMDTPSSRDDEEADGAPASLSSSLPATGLSTSHGIRENDIDNETMSKIAALDLDPLDQYSLAHKGSSVEEYIPETE